MYSIGDMAQLGGVTPRTLRHYHELGVLIPADVDAASGYRRYDPSQLAGLLRLLALKDLGFSLTEIKRIVLDDPGPAELRGMLLLRRAEIESERDRATQRLGQVEAHIHRLERQMSGTHDTIEITTKPLPPVHLAVTSGVSPSFEPRDVGPTIRPLYPPLLAALEAAGATATGPSVAFYDDAVDGGIGVHAGFPIDPAIVEVAGIDVVDLPPVELAATAVHHGDMAECVTTVVAIFDWMHEHGYRTTGYSREVYLACPDDISRWRTEMQFPIERA